MFKKILRLAGATVIGGIVALGTATAQDKNITIGVSIPSADHGWTAGIIYHTERVAEQLRAQYPGVNIIVKTSPDPASQANALQDLAVQNLDALVILPTDPDPLVEAIKEIKGSGAFVALVDRQPSVNDDSVRDLYLAGDNPAFGRVAGEYIKNTTPDAQVVVIRGMPVLIDQQRQDGFDEGIAGSNVSVLERQYGNWSQDDAFRVMQDFLTKYQKIDVVWCQDDDMAIGVLEAIAQSGRTDVQYVIGGAGSKVMIKRVLDGDKMIPVDVLYPAEMVATALQITAGHFYNHVAVSGNYILDATLVTPENAEQFYFPDSPY